MGCNHLAGGGGWLEDHREFATSPDAHHPSGCYRIVFPGGVNEEEGTSAGGPLTAPSGGSWLVPEWPWGQLWGQPEGNISMTCS